MNPFQRLIRAAPRKPAAVHPPANQRRAVLSVEGLETRLMPANVFVVPISQLPDSSHFHTLGDAVNAAGAGGVITLEPGASPDAGVVSLNQGGVTIQGDPNVPAAILPSELIQLTGEAYTLTNLNLESLILGTAPGDTSTARNLVSKCIITSLVEDGVESTFTQNTVTGMASLRGDGHVVTNDIVINNLFTSQAVLPGILQLQSNLGTVVAQNTFVGGAPTQEAIDLVDCGGGLFPVTISNNTITLSGSDSVGISVRTDQGGRSYVNVFNNSIAASLYSLYLGQGPAPAPFVARVQGNDFRTGDVGVEIVAEDFTNLTIDLGGGSLGSLGGNNFRSFSRQATYAHAAISYFTGFTVSPVLLSAQENLFASAINTNSLVYSEFGNALRVDVDHALTDLQAFVQAIYNDLLGRTGSLDELDGWVNVLNSQGQTAVANDILRSSESLGRVVASFYIRFLGRQSDSAGRAGWINTLQHGTSLESVEAGFITSPEYLSHIDTDFVQSLYINLLGRTGSAVELAPWSNGIQALGLAGIANAFLTSQEYRADNVTADFATFLHRPPSSTEISQYAGSATDLLGIEAAILSSQECFANI